MARILLFIPPAAEGRPIARDLLYGCWCSGRRAGGVTYPPVPEVLLATILSRDGHQVEVADANVAPKAWPSVLARAKSFDLAVSQSSWFTMDADLHALGLLREANPRLRTSLFGAGPTFSGETFLRNPCMDHAIQGDPESPLLALANDLRSGIPSPRVLQARTTEDLDSLPLPDRARFLPHPPGGYRNPIPERYPFTTVFTSRGCAGDCRFCSAPAFSGKRRRAMSPHRVVEEVHHAIREGYRDLIFRDEHVDSPPGRLEEICRLLREDMTSLSPGWACNLRADGVDSGLLASMKAAGCHTIKVGVETGDFLLRAKAGKPIPDETYLRVFREARSLGIRAHAHFLIGVPGETAGTIRSTVRFAGRLRPASATFGILTPFPGVPLAEDTGKPVDRLSRGDAVDGFHSCAVSLPWTGGLSADDLEKAVRKAYRVFYLRPASLMSAIAGMLSRRGASNRIRAGIGVFAFFLSTRHGS